MIPKISVVMITYNHEAYIESAIQSILAQTFTDFELIIINDGSIDATEQKIKKFTDPRIHYFYQSNKGPSSATNAGIAHAKGEYIALTSGDDIAHEHRLEKQYHYFLAHPKTGVLFGRVDIINEHGKIIPKHPLVQLFNSTPSTLERSCLFRTLFFNGNHLNATTAMFPKEVFAQTNGFYIACLQLQDYMFWLTCLKKYPIVILNEKCTYYRVRTKGANLSSSKNDLRMFFEYETILENILDDIELDFFKKTFHGDLLDQNFQGNEAFEIEKAFIFLKHDYKNITKGFKDGLSSMGGKI